MVKRIFWLWSLPLGIGILGVVIFFNPGLIRWTDQGPRDMFSLDEVQGIQEGDIVLRRGVGLPSDLIINSLGEGLGVSHSGFIFMKDGEPWVVHTVSAGLSGVDGVQSQPLRVFNLNSRPNSLVLVRLNPQFRTAETLEKIKESAYGFLEKKIPFDNFYDFSESDKLYCTELLYQVLHFGGVWTSTKDLEWRGPVLGFSNFLNARWFTVILDHRS